MNKMIARLRQKVLLRKSVAWILMAALIFALLIAPGIPARAEGEGQNQGGEGQGEGQGEGGEGQGEDNPIDDGLDCVNLIVEGKYQSGDDLKQQILDEVNRIRQEACTQGLKIPGSDKNLTDADYHPVKWSADLERVALIRAAEIYQVKSYNRPCSGESTHAMQYSDFPIEPSAELIYWCDNGGIMGGLEKIYAEKERYELNNGDSEAYEYSSLIDPTVTYIGFACFTPDVYEEDTGFNRYNICSEFSTSTDELSENYVAPSKGEDPSIRVNTDFIRTVTARDARTHAQPISIEPNITAEVEATVTYSFGSSVCPYSGSGVISSGMYFESANPSIAEIINNKSVKGKTVGKTSITCTVGTVSGVCSVTVDTITNVLPLADITVVSGTAPELPDQIDVGWSLGGISKEDVTWEFPLPTDYLRREGCTYTVSGALTAKPEFTVTQRIIVEPATVVSVDGYATSVSTVAGTAPVLSPTAIVHWSNQEDETVEITWDEIPQESYSGPDDTEFTVNGTITAVVCANPYSAETLNISCTVTVGGAMITEIVSPDPIQTFKGHRPTGFPEKVTARWSNGDETEENVTWNTSISPTSYANVGSFTVTGSVAGTGRPATITVNVVEPKVTAIRFREGVNVRTQYEINSYPTIIENALEAVLESGDTEDISTSSAIGMGILTLSPNKFTEAGEQQVTITYTRDGDHTLTYAVNVRAKKLTNVTLGKGPDKTDYVVGQTLDTTGAKLTLNFSDNSNEHIDITADMLPEDLVLNEEGNEIKIPVSYYDAATDKTYTVNLILKVVLRNPVSMEIKTLPDRLDYVEGEEIDLTGGVLSVTYIDDITEDLDMTDEQVHLEEYTGYAGNEKETITVYLLKTDETKVTTTFDVAFYYDRTIDYTSKPCIFGKEYSMECTNGGATLIQSITVDGEDVPESELTISEVDEKITFSSKFMTDLSFGKHTVSVSWIVPTVTFEINVLWPFEDVKVRPGAWNYEGIKYIYLKGIMTGDDDNDGDGVTTFRPKDDVSRGQFITTLYRLAGSPGVSGDTPFTDVKPHKYYATAVLWAYQNDITTGTSPTTFDPEISIQRQQMATLLMRFADYMKFDTSEKADIKTMPDYKKVNSYARAALSWANAKGIITGKEDTATGVHWLAPRDNTTRQECATILQRFYQAYMEKNNTEK